MTAAIIRLITGAQARWVGVEPIAADGSIPQRIYFANHSSHLDAPVVWASLPDAMRRKTRPVAARDYWERNAIRRRLASKVFRAVLIDRTKVSAHSNPLAPLEEALDQGDSLILFPEGTRGTERLPAPFKSGLFHLAMRHPDVELVPVYLENLYRSMPKGSLLPVPLSCVARFGGPMKLLAGEPKKDFLQRARAAVVALA